MAQFAGEFGDGDIAFCPCQHGRNADRENREIGMPQPFRFAVVRELAKETEEIFELFATYRAGLHRPPPGWMRIWIGKHLYRLLLQRINQDLFGDCIVGISLSGFRETSCLSDHPPVGGSITSSGETWCLDEGLSQENGMAMDSQPVVCQTFQVQRENFRGQVFDTDAGQNEKTAVVGNQVEPLVLDDRSPSDKAVSIFAFQGCGLPTKQSQPVIFKYSYIAKCFPDKGMKAEVMVLTDKATLAIS